MAEPKKRGRPPKNKTDKPKSKTEADSGKTTLSKTLPKRQQQMSIAKNTSASSEEISQMMGNVLYWYSREEVQSDDECAERLNEFFQHMRETGEIPTVEKMCLALGTVRQRVWEWGNGTKGPVRAQMIRKAKEIMAALDAELASSGKIPQVVYIFRAKNFHGMSDQTEVVVTPNNALGDIKPPDLLEEYLNTVDAD